MRRSLVAAVMLASLAVPGVLRASAEDGIAARPVTRTPVPRPPLGRPNGTPTVAPKGTPATTLVNEKRAVGLGVAPDSLVVEKALRRLTFWAGGLPIRTYDVALGGSPTGHKERQGDRRTPEGLYRIDARNAKSKFHRGLHVSYPNADDVARARALGVDPGGDIMLHGLPNGQGNVGAAHRTWDWTNGCVAMTNQEIEELFASVPVGTPIRFLP
ncbi:L,D-transpeptidase family protein [Roseisolibacter sp. H3M3-2]|uniref:L,D-transpeptidase family protein n=1 Tax=Roseisolibacter sp. H3M3-2 TaxID=3031323 RepID=UPI0023D9EB96|nr:L,D-transpeptidase family protein [Roseisolibacter sp. H3M3-2]MDF1502830.1 L,D-transpeptidase family protein [Roseisolibacter sp. H3M3-2]